MKFLKIAKYIILIVLMVFTILLNWGQGFLAKQGIVYSERMVLIKIVMTWLIVPITLVLSYGSFMSRKLEDSRAVASVYISNGIIIFVISIAFVVRLFYFGLFEGNIPRSTYVRDTDTYYEKINPYLYREVIRSAESAHNQDVQYADIERPEQIESDDQLTKETEASGGEEVQAPEEETAEVDESVEITEPEKNENSSQRYIMYSEALMQILTDRTDPDGRYFDGYFDDGSQGVDFSRNCFAIIDIDGDGRDELIFNFNDTYMAAMREIIYDYDEEDVMLRTELEDVFPFTTYYSNGYVKEEASHNHTCDPETRGIWPYYLYEYDADTDSYISIGYVQCWDKLIFPTNYEGETFPDEFDADGDQLLYFVGYFSEESDDVECTYMDREEFEAWEQVMFPDEYKIDIEYHHMTEEEIEKIKTK